MVSTPPAVLDERLDIEDGVLGVHVGEEAVDQRGDLLLVERRQALRRCDEVMGRRSGRPVRGWQVAAVWREEHTDEGIRGVSPVEDLPLQDSVGAGAVRRDAQKVTRGLVCGSCRREIGFHRELMLRAGKDIICLISLVHTCGDGRGVDVLCWNWPCLTLSISWRRASRRSNMVCVAVSSLRPCQSTPCQEDRNVFNIRDLLGRVAHVLADDPACSTQATAWPLLVALDLAQATWLTGGLTTLEYQSVSKL